MQESDRGVHPAGSERYGMASSVSAQANQPLDPERLLSAADEILAEEVGRWGTRLAAMEVSPQGSGH